MNYLEEVAIASATKCHVVDHVIYSSGLYIEFNANALIFTNYSAITMIFLSHQLYKQHKACIAGFANMIHCI